MKLSLKNFERQKGIVKKVKNMVDEKGRNIYKNIKGKENEINYKIIDLPMKKTGLKNLVVVLTVLYPGKMTTGHSHKNSEEVYIFLEGRGMVVLGKRMIKVKEKDIVTVPKKTWHRVVNTGKRKQISLQIFERTDREERGVRL